MDLLTASPQRQFIPGMAVALIVAEDPNYKEMLEDFWPRLER
jgi:hypothetical protein